MTDPNAAAPISPAARRRGFAVAVLVAAFTILDLTKVNVALPAIETAFDIGSTELQLIVSGFVLTFGLTLVPMGRLGDQRSRRVLFVVGLSLFTLTSLACALAPTSEVLLIARLLQGVAAGIQMPQVVGLIQELYQGPERGRAFGMFGATIGLATAFGPTLGGLLIALGGPVDGWRWVFGMNVPLGLLAIILVLTLLPHTRARSERPLELDPVGIALFGVSIVVLLWPFLFTTGSPDDDPARWWVLAALPVTLTAFVLWERRYTASGRAPLIELSLMRITSFRNGTIIASVYFAAMPTMFLLTTLYLQGGVELAAVFAGMVTIGFALSSAAASWLSGRLVERFGRALVVWGLGILLVSVGGLVASAMWLPTGPSIAAMVIVFAIGGIGGGVVIAPNQTLTLADVPLEQGGVAGSLGQLGQRVGTAIGSAIGLALFSSTVFSESGSKPAIDVFHDAYGVGMAAVAVLLAVALLLAIGDLVARRRSTFV